MRVVGVHLGVYFYFERTVVFSGRRSGRACARGASRQRLWLQHSQTADLSKYNPRSALAVGIASLPVARHRAHRPLHRHPPYRVVVRDQNAPVLVPRQARWAVEARGRALPRLRSPPPHCRPACARRRTLTRGAGRGFICPQPRCGQLRPQSCFQGSRSARLAPAVGPPPLRRPMTRVDLFLNKRVLGQRKRCSIKR